MRTNKLKQLLLGISRRTRRVGDRLSIYRSSAFRPRALTWLLLFVMTVHAVNLPFAAASATLREPMASAGRKTGVTAPRPSSAAPQVVETFNVYGPHRFDRTAGGPAALPDDLAASAAR